MTDQELIQAFHAMWDNFPEAVTMILKSREIIAVNKRGQELGIQPGIKCSSLGSPEQHKGCLCNKAANTKEPVYITYQGPFGQAYGYWLPVPEKPEWIIHLGVGSHFAYPEHSVKKVPFNK